MTRKTSPFAHILAVVAFFLESLTIPVGLAALAQQARPAAQTRAKRTTVAVAPRGASLAPPRHDPALASGNPTDAQPSLLASSSRQSTTADSEVVTFLPPVTYNAGEDNPWGVSIADLNGDGKPDLIVTNDSGGQVGVLLGNGDGTFKTAVTYDSGAEPTYSAAIADLDEDGKPDIVIASASYVSVLPGNGDGTFRSPHHYDSGPGGPYESYVTIADLNGDGKLDLAVGHSCGGTCTTGLVSVLVGNGDGTFRPAVTYPSGGVGNYSVAVADVNGDGKPDLIVSNWCASSSCDTPGPTEGSVGVLLGNGDGTFQPPASFDSGGHGTISVAVADLNRDGILDLVVASCGPSSCGPWPGGNVGVLLGKGDGTFQPVVTYSAGTAPYSIRVADVQRDGKPDILAGNWVSSSQSSAGFSVLIGNGDGTFQPVTFFSSGANEVPSIAVEDLNGDGKPDVVAASAGTLWDNPPPGVVSVLLNASGSAEVPTNTTVMSLPNPSVFGQSATFTATVASSLGSPTGTIQILYGSAVVGDGTLASGSVSIPVSTLPAGTDLVTASYLGGGGFSPSQSTPLTQTVRKATTATSVTSLPNPAGTNQSVTLTAAVSSQYGGATTGTVAFMAGVRNLGSAAIRGNVASLTMSFATAGTYSITAHYNGDSNNTGSTSSPLSVKIIAATTTALVSSLNPSVVGRAVSFTATVTSSAGIPPNGETMTFYSGTAVLGTVALSAGAAMLTTSALPAGVSTITARFPGDSTFAASTSPLIRQVVNATTKSVTSTTLASSLNPSLYGQPVTWVAMVTTAGTIAPTGNVVFRWSRDGQNYTIGTAPVNANGVAILTKSRLNADPFGEPYPLVAVYSGDALNLRSTSAVLPQHVLQTKTAASITSLVNPSGPGQAVTFTATITSPTVTPTGPVTFSVGKQVLGTAQIVPWAHKATLAISTLPIGSTVVTVTYVGDSNIAKSSASLTQTVQ